MPQVQYIQNVQQGVNAANYEATRATNAENLANAYKGINDHNTQTIKDVISSHNQVSAQYAKAQVELNNTKNTLTQTQQEKAQLNGQLKALEQSGKQDKAKIEWLSKQIKGKDNQINQLLDQQAQLSKELNDQKAKNDDLAKKLAQSRVNEQAAKDYAQAAIDHSTKQQQQIDTLQKSNDDLSKQLKGKEFSRSLYIVEDVKKNQIVTKKNVKSIRPGYGLHPKYYNEILGKKFVKDIEKGERMNLNLVR